MKSFELADPHIATKKLNVNKKDALEGNLDKKAS